VLALLTLTAMDNLLTPALAIALAPTLALHLKFETTLIALVLAPQTSAMSVEPSVTPQLVLALALLQLAPLQIKLETPAAIVSAMFNVLHLRSEAPILTFADVSVLTLALLDSLSTQLTAIVTVLRLALTLTLTRTTVLVDLALETGLRMEMDNALFALQLLLALDQEL